jgi:phospholipid/cholesterol/gamma-HCH transport system substrate-binding protein
METRASYVLVGSFVLGLVAAAVIFVLWIGGSTRSDKIPYHVILTGNVTGLAPGAAVRYRGIQKGEVGAITLRAPTPYEVEKFKVAGEVIDVEIKVSPDTPMFTDTTASLEVQGLTGTPFLQLKRKLDPAATRIDPKNKEHAVIQGETSGLDKIFEEFPKAIASITELANRASNLLDQENQDNFKSLIKNASESLAAVKEFAADGKAVIKDMREPINDLGKLAQRGEKTMVEIEKGAASFAGVMGDFRVIVRENRRPIADFAATGLYEFSLFLTDMRKFVRTFDRILVRLEGDPSQFLFGNRQRGFETQGNPR